MCSQPRGFAEHSPGSQLYAQLGHSKSVKEETQAASEKSLELLKSDVFEVTQS